MEYVLNMRWDGKSSIQVTTRDDVCITDVVTVVEIPVSCIICHSHDARHFLK